MHPTLEPGDTIFVAKWPLGFNRQVKRGDVLIFANPAEPDRDYIKRAIAVAGDTVEVKKGRVTLNGKPLTLPDAHRDAACGREEVPTDETPRTHDVCWEQPLVEDFGPEKVPEGNVFVLGDLRSQSPLDVKKRRTWGMVPVALIKGKARWIWLSIEPHNSDTSTGQIP